MYNKQQGHVLRTDKHCSNQIAFTHTYTFQTLVVLLENTGNFFVAEAAVPLCCFVRKILDFFTMRKFSFQSFFFNCLFCLFFIFYCLYFLPFVKQIIVEQLLHVSNTSVFSVSLLSLACFSTKLTAYLIYPKNMKYKSRYK